MIVSMAIQFNHVQHLAVVTHIIDPETLPPALFLTEYQTSTFHTLVQECSGAVFLDNWLHSKIEWKRSAKCKGCHTSALQTSGQLHFAYL